MAYSPKYTSEVKIEGELQITIDSSSSPTTNQTLVWIEEEETEIDNIGYGTRTLTNETLDVPEDYEATKAPRGTLRWFEEIAGEAAKLGLEGKLVIPSYRPIISVANMYRRTSNLGGAEVWESLTEGLANDYVIIKRNTKAGPRGYGFYFFDKIPTSGTQRLKSTFTYGMALQTAVLSKYATLKVCLRVLMAKAQTANPSSLTQFVGGSIQTYVPTQYAGKMTEIMNRIAKWEKDWTEQTIAIGVGF